MKFYFIIAFKIVLLLVSALTLTSCLSPVKTPPNTTYVLNAVPEQRPVRQTRSVTLLVMQPETASAYDTTRMAYTTYPYQIAYFAQNSWAETPAQMLQPLLVQTLRNTHRFRAVVTPPYVARYDYVLVTQILMLQQNFAVAPQSVELKVNVQINSMNSNRVIASKEFYVREPIANAGLYSGAVAANRATEQLLQQIAEFCVRTI